MNIARTIARNTLFGSVETGVDLITGFSLGIVLARSLGTSQYGLYAYLTWLLGLVTLLADVGLGETVKRFIAEAVGQGNRDEAKGVIRLTLVIRSAAAVIVGVGLIISSAYWPSSGDDAQTKYYFLIVALTILPQGLHYAFLSIFRGFQKYEYAAYVTMCTSTLRLVLIIILLFFGAGVREVLIVQIGTFCLGTILGLYFLNRLVPLKSLAVPFSIDTVLRHKTIRYTFTLAGILIINYLASNQLSTFFIEHYCPVDQVGFFRLATRMVSMPVALLPTAFSFVLTPAIAEQFGKGDMGKIRAVYLASVRYLMMLAIPLEIGLITLASPLINLLYGAKFIPTITIMQILMIPSAVVSISNAATAVIYGTNRPSSVFKINLLFAFYSIGMSLWLIPRYGVLGAAIINAIPLSPILIIIFATKHIKTGWPVKDTIKITAAGLLMGAAVFFLQSQVNMVLAIALGVPLGIAIYAVLILLFGVIHEEDMTILKNAQGSLPVVLKKPCLLFTVFVEKFMLKANHRVSNNLILKG